MEFKELQVSLEQKGYQVSEFENKEEAARYLNEQIDGKSVGFGGSVTLDEMGLYESLGTHNKVWWHWKGADGLTVPEIHKEAAVAQIYLSSVNGIAKTGEIVNIDGTGNRVASTIYGHEKVYFVVGENKIANTLEGAMERARNIAAPLNARRLNRKTPCAVKADHCYDCKSPERICKAASIFWGKPNSQEFEVVLIHEKLGY
ncbi:Uncharacterised ACR, YkgG family COG1556 [Lachnospiraceae bacterium XBB1006]|nr:Uncharacterised ACR, YkgG family COG1556 [Lachnospiraceae bacterium XBB1006]